MTPAQAKQDDTFLVIEHPLGGKRYPAHIFNLNQGIAWIEYGWADGGLGAPSNPVHMVEGKVEATSEGQWQIESKDGLVTLRTLIRGTEQDEDTIMKMVNMPAGDREVARERIEGSLSIKLPPQQ